MFRIVVPLVVVVLLILAFPQHFTFLYDLFGVETTEDVATDGSDMAGTDVVPAIPAGDPTAAPAAPGGDPFASLFNGQEGAAPTADTATDATNGTEASTDDLNANPYGEAPATQADQDAEGEAAALAAALTGAKEEAADATEAAAEMVEDTAEEMAEELKDVTMPVVDATAEKAEDVAEDVVDATKTAEEKTAETVKAIAEDVKEAAEETEAAPAVEEAAESVVEDVKEEAAPVVTEPAAEEKVEAPKPQPSGLATAEEMMAEKVLGGPDAKVTVIEYVSLTCPHCARFHESTYQELKKNYIDTAKIKFIMRDFPFSKTALEAAMLTRCVKPAKYEAFKGVLFKTQNDWLTKDQPLPALKNYAKQAGLNDADIEACLNNEGLKRTLLQRQLEAQQTYKVDATPTLIINDQVFPGALSYPDLKKAIDAVLAAPAQ